MIRNHSRSQTRSAFTLVELIVVLLIILILVSLIGSAVLKAMDKIPEVSTRAEITELEVALRAFMSDYNLSEPPPSSLVLNEFTPTLTVSGPFLTKLFGKSLGPTDWNGNGMIDGPAAPGGWVLEGEQCLVFYLGGIPSLVGPNTFAMQGFSTNNMKPSYGSMPQPPFNEVMGKRKGPYYTFQTNRLVSMALVNPFAAVLSPLHPAYIDAWQVKTTLNPPGVPPMATHIAPVANGIPYAYFSSQGINNGYTINDCFTGLSATPYFIMGTAPVQYMNPNTYQIISAGKNGTFGTATTGCPGWVPSSGATGAGIDDQSNFSGGLLGAGQQ